MSSNQCCGRGSSAWEEVRKKGSYMCNDPEFSKMGSDELDFQQTY